jgi:hypothetical protein
MQGVDYVIQSMLSPRSADCFKSGQLIHLGVY